MPIVNISNQLPQDATARLLPPEGPKFLPIIIDLSTTLNWTIDLSTLYDARNMTMVQTLFIDASDPNLGATVSIDMGAGGIQTIKAKPNTQGYYEIMCPNPPKMVVSTTAAGGLLRLGICNVAVPGVVWSTV